MAEFGFVCVSHDPHLPSPLWGYRPERLHALLAVRANLVGLAAVDSVTLAEDARWLLWHPGCKVELASAAGTVIALEEAVAAADADPEVDAADGEEEPTEDGSGDAASDAGKRASDADDGEVTEGEAAVEEAEEPPPAPAQLSAKQVRRPRSMPDPPWRCVDCERELTEQEALLSWTRRVLVCPEHIQARRVG